MAAFSPGRMVTSTQPAVQVDGITVPGIYQFQLVVVDDRSIASAPASILVQIVGPGATDPRMGAAI